MGKIISSAPVLLVRDVIASAEYHRDRMGFAYEQFWGDPPSFCMPKRDGHIVMLAQAENAVDVVPHWKRVKQMWNIYFWVDDVEAIYQEMQDRGATIDYELHRKPYDVLEFGVQDLDGHDIAFGQAV